ncbi:MAG: hypothetical protein JXB05_20595 [Myxococcaceae bacterium]|nr:hypothetical protein [Myxococcaceae bacterium]
MQRVLAFLVAVFLVGCGAEAPELPPKESMTIDFKSLDSSSQGLQPGQQSVDPGARTHWTQAALRVGILNLWVGVGLAPHVAVFHAAHSQAAKAQGDEWVWTYSVKNGTVDATATLTARMDGKASVWQMRIDGKVGAEQLSDFLWYEGRYEVSTGYWQLYNLEGKHIRIDWELNSPTDKELKFTDNTGGAEDGNFLTYKLAGDQASVSYDFKSNKKADISWSVSSKAGSILAADFAGHENQKACWDSQLFDVQCQ